MGYGENRLRIIWICHFLDKALKIRLRIDENENEFSPWISLGIEEIKKKSDIELHIIAPLYRVSRNCHLSDGNIHYHFIKAGIPLLKTSWPQFFRPDRWTNYYSFNIQANRLIKKIQPDIVNLHGVENPYYSISVLGIKGYPVLVTIQGFASLSNIDTSKDPERRQRMEIEKRILSKLKYFGTQASFMEKYIRTFNPNAKIYTCLYPYAKTNINSDLPKVYDLVYFASISKVKGIEDLIKCLALVKKNKSNITLCIMGRGEKTYLKYLGNLIDDLNLTSNVIFKGFMPTQREMHSEAVRARISVLPTYNDITPGTIIESMLLGIPVISYNVGGIPDLNIGEERIILVEKGDIPALASEITNLIDNETRQKELSIKAKQFAEFRYNNATSVTRMVNLYRDIIEEYKNE